VIVENFERIKDIANVDDPHIITKVRYPGITYDVTSSFKEIDKK